MIDITEGTDEQDYNLTFVRKEESTTSFIINKDLPKGTKIIVYRKNSKSLLEFIEPKGSMEDEN